MSRTQAESDDSDSGLSQDRDDLFGPVQLTKLLFQSIESPSKFIHLFLAWNADVLKEIVSVAFQVPPHLLLKLWGLSPQGLEHVVHQCGSLVWIELAVADPCLGHPAQPLGHQGGGAESTEQKLLKRVGVHGRQQRAAVQDGLVLPR